jgi:hypothetical protein
MKNAGPSTALRSGRDDDSIAEEKCFSLKLLRPPKNCHPDRSEAQWRDLRFPLRDRLNPLASPGWRLEGIREILCLVHDLAVAELHNAHCVCRPPLVGDCVFRDPEITLPENSLDVKPRRLAGMMTPQGLQIPSSEDSFARLGIIADSIVIVNIVFSVLHRRLRTHANAHSGRHVFVLLASTAPGVV